MNDIHGAKFDPRTRTFHTRDGRIAVEVAPRRWELTAQSKRAGRRHDPATDAVKRALLELELDASFDQVQARVTSPRKGARAPATNFERLVAQVRQEYPDADQTYVGVVAQGRLGEIAQDLWRRLGCHPLEAEQLAQRWAAQER